MRENQGDAIVLRRFQGAFVNKALARFTQMGERIMVADVHPGSGKTLAMLHTANELYRLGLIDSVAVFVPRINLCQQFEMDWKAVSPLYSSPKMNTIDHRTNEPPLLRGKAFGYVTTYASLASAQSLHLNFIKNHRAALILDEAQILGTDEGGGTEAAKAVESLGKYAKYIIVASGTAYRSDGKRLLFAKYTDPDEWGRIYLDPDTYASYQLGVSEGYLRPFEFQLSDGQSIYEYLNGTQETFDLSTASSGLHKILVAESFWSGIVDSAIKKVQELQRHVDPRLCGLIGAFNQNQADEIANYIKRRHPSIKALVAVSKEEDAQDNLRAFKRGGYDILITVRMAYVGYDHKPISVVATLTHFRDEGHLRQLFARGMRVMPDVPLDQQTLWVFAPDDLRMADFVERLRNESKAGLIERELRTKEAGEPSQPQLGYTVDARETGRRNMGMNPDGDVSQQEHPVISDLMAEHRLGAAPYTGVASLLRAAGVNILQAFGVRTPKMETPLTDNRTEREKEMDLRRQLAQLAQEIDGKLLRTKYITEKQRGYAMKECNAHFRKSGVSHYSQDELRAAQDWLRKTLLPFANALEGK